MAKDAPVLGGAVFTTATKAVGSASMSFDGTGYITVEDTYLSATDFAQGFTISTWVNATTAGGASGGIIFDKSDGAQGMNGLVFSLLDASGQHSIRLRVASGAQVVASFANYQTWRHAVVTMTSAGATTIYLDNASVATGTASGASFITTTSFGKIGANSAGTANGWNGYIDDFRIYNRVLSTDEIADLYLGNDTVKMGCKVKYTFEEASGAIALDTANPTLGDSSSAVVRGAR